MFGISATFITILVVSVLIIATLATIFWTFHHAIPLMLNSIIGFFALFAVQAYVMSDLIINIWNVILVALAGLPGFLIVIALHFFGIAF
jgi:hypothetical protein